MKEKNQHKKKLKKSIEIKNYYQSLKIESKKILFVFIESALHLFFGQLLALETRLFDLQLFQVAVDDRIEMVKLTL